MTAARRFTARGGDAVDVAVAIALHVEALSRALSDQAVEHEPL